MKFRKPEPHRHGPPVTRRDFLARGLVSMATTSMVPTALGLFLRSEAAEAACTPAGAAPGTLPFIVFDLAGGGALPGNFLVGKAGGPQDFLSSYNLLGWDPRAAGALNTQFGLPMSAQASKILQGMQASASATALSKVRMGSICHSGMADSNTNGNSAAILVSQAGLNGKVLATGTGSRITRDSVTGQINASSMNSFSGGNTTVPVANPALKPLPVGSYSDLLSGFSFGPSFTANKQPPALAAAVGKALQALSAEQLGKLSHMNLGAQMTNLLGCGYAANYAIAQNPPTDAQTNPRNNANSGLWPAFGLSASSADNASATVLATVVMNCLNGNTGPAVITLGGFDYHTNDTTGDTYDLLAGNTIGQVIQAASILGQAFMFQIVTDGGIRAMPGTRNWYEDTSDSMTIIGYFNPANPPTLVRQQVGAFTDGQIADTTTDLGSSTQRVGYAVFLNYMSVCGLIGNFRNFVSEAALPTPNGGLSKYLLFG